MPAWAAVTDADEDGLPDLEHGMDFTLFHQTSAGTSWASRCCRREPGRGLVGRDPARVDVRDHVAITVGLAELRIVDDVRRHAVAGAEPAPLAEQDHRDLGAGLLPDLVLEPHPREPRRHRRADPQAARATRLGDRIMRGARPGLVS